MINKLYSMIGIGKKAGYIVIGETGCIQTIKRRKCKLIILASDASENTKNRLISLCKNSNIEYVIIGKKEELGNAVGKGLSSIISITDLSFSEAIIKITDKIV